jgi:hypothetical protein
MPTSEDRVEGSLKHLRIVHVALLVSLGLYAFMGEWIQKKPETLDPMVLKVMAGLALATGTVILFVRMRLILDAEEKLGLQPTDMSAFARWHVLHFISFVLCESIGLYGIALRFMGASFRQAAAFYAGAILLMLLSTPRRP